MKIGPGFIIAGKQHDTK